MRFEFAVNEPGADGARVFPLSTELREQLARVEEVSVDHSKR